MKENKIKILFVCLGNICRSPAAEGAFQSLIHKESLDDFFIIDSAGTAGYHDGELADPRTRKVAKARNIQLTHISRKLIKQDFQKFDYILVMDHNNFKNVRSLATDESHNRKIHFFRSFEEGQFKNAEVPDPYYGDLEAFENVQNIVESASVGFLKFLKSEHQIFPNQ